MSVLFDPDEHEIEMERRGRVFIYDGLRDTVVERALDEQYGRVEHMMFINTVVTDANGQPRTDPVTGGLLIEGDGCD